MEMDPVWTPHLVWGKSALLREALDQRYFYFWDYEVDGPFPKHREVKHEVEHLVQEVLSRNEISRVLGLVESDGQFMSGDPYRGGKPVLELTPRLAALRVIDLSLIEAIAALDEAALGAPDRSSRSFAQVPGLFELLTPKDGLLPLDPDALDHENHADDRLFLHGEWALYPHRQIREHRELIADLIGLATSGFDVKIAIDANRLHRREGRPNIGLKDHWYGIKVEMASIDDPTIHGRTTYVRRVTEHSFHPVPILALTVAVSVDGDLKTFSVEEVVPPHGNSSENYVINRFLHSIRNMAQGTWTHADGSIKAYSRREYQPTTDQPTAPLGAAAHYTKMWRVDGEVDDEIWGRLLGHHFRGNELVGEAFGDWVT